MRGRGGPTPACAPRLRGCPTVTPSPHPHPPMPSLLSTGPSCGRARADRPARLPGTPPTRCAARRGPTLGHRPACGASRSRTDGPGQRCPRLRCGAMRRTRAGPPCRPRRAVGLASSPRRAGSTRSLRSPGPPRRSRPRSGAGRGGTGGSQVAGAGVPRTATPRPPTHAQLHDPTTPRPHDPTTPRPHPPAPVRPRSPWPPPLVARHQRRGMQPPPFVRTALRRCRALTRAPVLPPPTLPSQQRLLQQPSGLRILT